jgi:hypothetical protein
MRRKVTFEIVRPASQSDDLATKVPLEFRDVIDRHQNNLTGLAAALRGSGMTPVAAAACVDAALVSFRDGLAAAVKRQEVLQRDRH